MNEQRLYRRIVRRERHRSRSVAVSIALSLLALCAAYAGIEIALAALGRDPLLVSPAAALHWVDAGSAVALSVAGAAAIVGAILVIVAVTPGRRARHSIPTERMAVVVDDAVLAGAFARAARRPAQVAADRVVADVSARRARVFITPTSGVAVDTEATRSAVDRVLDTLAPRPALRTTVTVATTGVVGS